MNTLKTNHIAYLDTLRVVACLLVILTHSPIPHDNMGSSLSYVSIYYLCLPCIGLFLMISGALLLPMRVPTKEFLHKRLPRIIFPLISWSVIYIIIALLVNKLTISEGIYNLLLIPFKCVKGFDHGWFLYTIIGIYLFIPIFNAWINNNSLRRTQYFILLWGITLCFPYIIARFGTIQSDTLYTFASYFGYVVLGYYLHHHPISLDSAPKWLVLISVTIIVGMVLPVIMYRYYSPGYNLYNDLQLSVVVMCVLIFCCIQSFNPKSHLWNKCMRHLSGLTFGIYLVNFAILRNLFTPYFTQNPLASPLLEILIAFIGSAIISYLIIWSIQKLPFKRYIIG